MQANVSYSVNPTTNQQSQEGDPLYSVIDARDTPGYTQPPKLPPSNRVPYYQEIESDGTAAAPNEMPKKTTKTSQFNPQQGIAGNSAYL